MTAYVNERKIEESKYLLAQPGANILKVSTALGYSSPNYFATLFRQITGKTPSQWVGKE